MRCIKYIVVTENCFLRMVVKDLIRQSVENKASYIIIDGHFAGRAAAVACRSLACDTYILYDDAHRPQFISSDSPHILPLPRSVPMLRDLIIATVEQTLSIHQPHTDPMAPLTSRELNILRQILGGDSPGKISRIENISIKTVSAFKRRAMHKLQVNTLQELYYRIVSH